MELSGVHHVSINVSDLEATAAFYLDVLGLEKLPRPEIPVEGIWLGCTDGSQIHLIINPVPTSEGQHYAFGVADLDAVITELAGQGIAASKPITVEGVCRQAFCTDPSGNLVEFNQSLAA